MFKQLRLEQLRPWPKPKLNLNSARLDVSQCPIAVQGRGLAAGWPSVNCVSGMCN